MAPQIASGKRKSALGGAKPPLAPLYRARQLLSALRARVSAEERAYIDRGLVAELMTTPDPADALVAEVIGRVTAAGGLDYARRRALELAQQADAELDILPASPARDALRDSIAYAVERRS